MSIKEGVKKGSSKAAEKAASSPWVWLAGGVALFFGGRYIYKKSSGFIQDMRQRNIENQLDTGGKKDPRGSYAVQYAQRIQAAIDGWGTDEEAIYKVAREMKQTNVPYSMVAEAYRKIFNSNMTTDLQDDLSSSEIAEFYSYLRGTSTVSGLPSGLLGLI